MARTRLVERLLEQAERLTNGAKVKTIRIRAGALSNVSPTVMARRLSQATVGTNLEGAALEFEFGHDPLAADALHVTVVGVELAD